MSMLNCDEPFDHFWLQNFNLFVHGYTGYTYLTAIGGHSTKHRNDPLIQYGTDIKYIYVKSRAMDSNFFASVRITDKPN